MKKKKVSLLELWCHLDLFTKCILGVPLVILALSAFSLLFSNWTVYGADGKSLTGFYAIMVKNAAILILVVIAGIIGYLIKGVVSDIYHSIRYLLQCSVEEDIEAEVNADRSSLND